MCCHLVLEHLFLFYSIQSINVIFFFFFFWVLFSGSFLLQLNIAHILNLLTKEIRFALKCQTRKGLIRSDGGVLIKAYVWPLCVSTKIIFLSEDAFYSSSRERTASGGQCANQQGNYKTDLLLQKLKKVHRNMQRLKKTLPLSVKSNMKYESLRAGYTGNKIKIT